MRWRPLLWLLVSVCCFIGALYFWQLGDRVAAERRSKSHPDTNQVAPQNVASNQAAPKTSALQSGQFQLLSQPASLSVASAPTPVSSSTNAAARSLSHRLSNTTAPVRDLVKNDKAILLENALIDTASGKGLAIPDRLRAQGDPGAYIIQARKGIDLAFRAGLERAGAMVVSYIPNNAFLVRASLDVAQGLRGAPGVQAVLPYEPYYKLKPSLLQLALEGTDAQAVLPEGSVLNVLLFADAQTTAADELQRLGAEVLNEQRSPFGQLLQVRPPANIADIAALPGVQAVELSRHRITANDLSRAALGITPDSVAETNYLSLTGSNVLVALVDTGVDAQHPDLTGRILFDNNPLFPVLPDTDGHGTFMAGVILGDGNKSESVTNVPGSPTAGSPKQFRGKAPGAKAFVMDFGMPDTYLQETAARTNALIANNSWTYDVNDYDLAAASYDAAVRDSLPLRTGSQPVLYVFPAGNFGNLNRTFGSVYDAGQGGVPDTILSPGTAKNVITVGAVEQPRNITNEVYDCAAGYCVTNAGWQPSTDSNDQVAGFSGRGNVGIGIEGEFGRFKPDVVAPGTFVVSTRSGDWDESGYYLATNAQVQAAANLTVGPSNLWLDSIFVPADAVRVLIRVFPNSKSPIPFPNLPIYVKVGAPSPGTSNYDFVTHNNQVIMPGDHPLSPTDTSWSYAVGNDTTQAVSFDVVATVFTTTVHGSYMTVLSNLNETIGPYYRFESGSSVAAASASGSLALMQEYFEQRLGRTNSPALMKALLINGARSLGNLYDFRVNTGINYQGWGQIYLPGSIHPVSSNSTPDSTSMLVFDQSPTNALASGQSRTYNLSLSPEGQQLPLRVTLVWTDPPGNPVAGVKLVNDLDLVVTNLDTGEIYFGNDIIAGNDFNSPWNTNMVPNIDSINNVENVYLAPNFFASLGTNYSITVVGHHVNVNAVTAHPNDVAQDFALVISSGNGEVTNTLRLVNSRVVARTEPWVTTITNMFPNGGTDVGGMLLNQHVGANTPLLGTSTIQLDPDRRLSLGITNQWHFYVFTNNTTYTNAAFLTYLPPTLALPRMGTRETQNENSTRPEADIDLYVSRDPGLTNLSPNVVASAWKSLGPGGTETIVLTNATPGTYYIGVKSEDHMAAEFSILGVVSQEPFSTEDQQGNQTLRAFPLPSYIPDGTPQKPGVSTVFAISINPVKVRRVIARNTLTHELMGDLIGTLTHDGKFATLNNHSTNTLVNSRLFIYDDSDELDVPGSQRSDGPGSLQVFGGGLSVGQWMFTQSDTAPPHVGTNEGFGIFLEKQQDPTEGVVADILPGACRLDYVDVPVDATNLTVSVSLRSGSGPVSLQLCPVGGLSTDCSMSTMSNSIGTSVSIFRGGRPALIPGTYAIRTCNLGVDKVQVYILATVHRAEGIVSLTTPNVGGPVAIRDDAVTYSTIDITNHLRISDLDVAMLIRHPRISDLAITLVSPRGTRILLFENRGNTSVAGLGNSGGIVGAETNLTAVYTADFDSVPSGPYAPGTLVQSWSVLKDLVNLVPDYSVPWRSNNFLVLGNGAISNSIPTDPLTRYQLAFDVTHAPYIAGTVAWWPFDGDANDIFSGLSGILRGNVQFTNGAVGQAFYGDGIATRMIVAAAPELNVGRSLGMTIEGWINPVDNTNTAPLVEWFQPGGPAGVQLWTADLTTNSTRPGVISAALRGLDGLPNFISTPAGTITNSVWQHVALTLDRSQTNPIARIYVNGQAIASQTFTNALTPATGGDLYFGYDPRGAGRAFAGGLDEFGLYNRVLTDCEINAIVNAGANGKYGTNALTCPVAVQVALSVGAAPNVVTFTNGQNWGAGPRWETNTVDFTSASGAPASVVITSLDPNTTIDNIRLLSPASTSLDALVHFTDNTNFATVPIKFAPTPFQLTNISVLNTFANHFGPAAPGVYLAGQTISGVRDWNVVSGPVAIVANPVLNAPSTNGLALVNGAVETPLPTTPGHRYRLSYRVRGPGAVSWWNGDVNPLNRRAFDLLGGNDGAFLGGAASYPTGYVASAFPGYPTNTLYFGGAQTNGAISKIELGDPENLKLTNSFTFEGWILPLPFTNAGAVTEQILFRGDARPCLDPYYLSLEPVDGLHSELHFHIEGENQPGCGVDVLTAGGAITRSETNWQHVAAVFETGLPITIQDGTNTITTSSNQMRLYINGSLVASNYTGVAPFRDLDPAFSPGVAIGNRSRYDYSQPFYGNIDELTVYGRALSTAELAFISTNRTGKADLTVAPGASLAKVTVSLDGVAAQTTYGDNAGWTSHSFEFTARNTNTVLNLQSLLPGTFVDRVLLEETPLEVSYLPEQALEQLNGEDAFGQWQLEIWDTRVGATNTNPTLVEWQLDFKLLPIIPPTPVLLQHGIPYVGALAPGEIQTFIVGVPQWATRATNALLYSVNAAGNAVPIGVLFNNQDIPSSITNALFWPPVASGQRTLTPSTRPQIQLGQPYYLTVTNTSAVGVTFAFGVWFDVTQLSICQPHRDFVPAAGIPRYFQFDVPTSGFPPPSTNGEPALPPQAVSFWLTGVDTNVTVVLSQSLPLPNLDQYDYISRAPSTNDEIVMVLTNTTPFPLQTNRWYVGVFNTREGGVPFAVNACYDTASPTIIPLTAGVPFTAEATNVFAAPPGPPRAFFFEFEVTNPVAAILFELYGLTGDADLVLQRDVPPTMAPYFATSYSFGRSPEQIVLRPNSFQPDLRGRYFLGVYNNEDVPVGYTIRAAVAGTNNLLLSGQPLRVSVIPRPGTGPLLSWNAVMGEQYTIQHSPDLLDAVWTTIGEMTATTPLATFLVPTDMGGYYRVVQGIIQPPPPPELRLRVTRIGTNEVRISWPTIFSEYRLQYSDGNLVDWHEWDTNAHPIFIEGQEYATYDTLHDPPRYYRLWTGAMPPPPVLITNLVIVKIDTNLLQLMWPTNLVGYRLQFAELDFVWQEWDTNANPISIVGTNYVTYDLIRATPRFYRLFQGELPPPPPPPPPTLITSVTNNQMQLLWPTNPPGYRLQYTDNLAQWNEWDTNAHPITVVGTNYITFDDLRPTPRWYRLTKEALPPPETPPLLGFQRVGPNQIEITWPTTPPGYRLQYSTNFTAWNEWDTNANPITIQGTNYVTHDQIYATPRFYRLTKEPLPPTGPPGLYLRKVSTNQIQITWPTTPPGYRLQYTEGNFAVWNEWDTNANPVTIQGTNYVTFDIIRDTPRFYRLTNEPIVPPAPPSLYFSKVGTNQIQIAWPTTPPGYRLQYTEGNFSVWNEWDTNANPVTIQGTNYVTFDIIRDTPRFYRLTKEAVPPPTAPPSLYFTKVGTNQIQIAWPTTPPGYRLQYTEGNFTVWNEWDTNANPVTIQGTNYVTFDLIRATPRFYRLVKSAAPPLGGQPTLTFARTGTNQIQIVWPTVPTGFKLQYTEGNFVTWLDWDTNANPIVVVGTNYVATDTIRATPRFYRLIEVTTPPPSEPPTVFMSKSGTNQIQIAWPVSAAGYRLQVSTNLTGWQDWDTNASPIVVLGSNYVATDTIGNGLRFYRLFGGVPAPEPATPALTLTRTGTNDVRIVWPSAPGGFRLLYSGLGLGPWSAWDTNASPPALVGTNYVILDNIGSTSRFYRLVK